MAENTEKSRYINYIGLKIKRLKMDCEMSFLKGIDKTFCCVKIITKIVNEGSYCNLHKNML